MAKLKNRLATKIQYRRVKKNKHNTLVQKKQHNSSNESRRETHKFSKNFGY